MRKKSVVLTQERIDNGLKIVPLPEMHATTADCDDLLLASLGLTMTFSSLCSCYRKNLTTCPEGLREGAISYIECSHVSLLDCSLATTITLSQRWLWITIRWNEFYIFQEVVLSWWLQSIAPCLPPAFKPSSNDDRAARGAGREDMPGRNPGFDTCGIACTMSL